MELPPGFRFVPTDMELVVHYLNPKIADSSFNVPWITEIDVNKYSPNDMIDMYRTTGEDKWYFFSSRQRKYGNGKRPNRKAGAGFWKKQSKVEDVKDKNGSKIGTKNILTFYNGNPPGSKDTKTNWIMYEYLIEEYQIPLGQQNDSKKLDDWVLYQVHYNEKGKNAENVELLQRETSSIEEQSEITTKDARVPQGENSAGDESQRPKKHARMCHGESSMGIKTQKQDENKVDVQTEWNYVEQLTGEAELQKYLDKGKRVLEENNGDEFLYHACSNGLQYLPFLEVRHESSNEVDLQRYLDKGKGVLVQNSSNEFLNPINSDRLQCPSSLEFQHQFPSSYSSPYYASYVAPTNVMGPSVPKPTVCDLQDNLDQDLNIFGSETSDSFMSCGDLDAYISDFYVYGNMFYSSYKDNHFEDIHTSQNNGDNKSNF